MRENLATGPDLQSKHDCELIKQEKSSKYTCDLPTPCELLPTFNTAGKSGGKLPTDGAE